MGVIFKILLQIAWDNQDTENKKRGVHEHKQQKPCIHQEKVDQNYKEHRKQWNLN